MKTATITMCIIDDIITVVKGIETKIPWEQYGITVVGTATNGEDGLALIQTYKPQIILTDIRMPKQSGIDMIKEAASGNAGAKVIFLSGYTEFSYAQESVRLGAFDYIVKPFTRDQIVEVVLRAKQELEAERLELANTLELEQKVRESLPHLRQEYFNLLLRGGSKTENAKEKWRFLEIEMADERFVVMIAKIGSADADDRPFSENETELARFAVRNILQETIHIHTSGLIVLSDSRQLTAILNPPPMLSVDELAELCRRNIETYAKKHVAIGVGGIAEEIGDMHCSFEQAQIALSYHFYTGGNCVIHFRDIERDGAIMPRYSADTEKELLFCLRSGNKDGAERLLDEVFAECSEYPAPPDPAIMTNLYYGLAFSMFRVMAEKTQDQERTKLEIKLSAFKDKQTVRQLEEGLRQFCFTGCELFEKRQTNDSQQLITEALEYIKRNLCTELTVQECAGAVHLSQSYFSNLFKRETGVTFMHYVTAARMERAKELLLEGMQVQEISYELGYKDRPYFSELFKKHAGVTPTEFRQKYVETTSSG